MAFPLFHARNQSLSPWIRLDNVFETGLQAMRLSALLLLADYLSSDEVAPDLAGPIRGLQQANWNEWSILCSKLSRFWRKLTDRSRFGQLARSWLAVSGAEPPTDQWRSLLEGLPGSNDKPATNANDALQTGRNTKYHRGGTATGDERISITRLARYLPVVEAEVAQLFGQSEFAIFRRVTHESAILLHGPHPDKRFEEVPLDPRVQAELAATGLAVAVGVEGVPLYPLFVLTEDEEGAPPYSADGLTEPVLLLEKVKTRRIELRGVLSEVRVSGKHAAPLLDALARKQTTFEKSADRADRWEVAEYARMTAREEVDSLRGRKYFPDCYVARSGPLGVDDVARACLEQPGRGLFLLGCAGSGKTSLLARLAENLTREDVAPEPSPSRSASGADSRALDRTRTEDVVIFISGGQAFAGDPRRSGTEVLRDAVAQRAGVRASDFRDLGALAERFNKTASLDREVNRRVWILLDAINEADHFADLLTAIDDFLPSLGRYKWLRLVVSMRAGAFHALERRRFEEATHGSGLFRNPRRLHSFKDEQTGRDVPYLLMRPFDPNTEGPSAYLLRQQRLPERATHVAYENLDATTKHLLLTPLHLHLFHDTWHGQDDPPPRLIEAKLFDSYLDHLRRDFENLEKTLPQIGRLLLKRRTRVVPSEDAEGWVREWRERLLERGSLPSARLNPIEELLAASVIRPREEGLGADRKLVGFEFSQQKLCEQVLLRTLRDEIRPRQTPTADEMSDWCSRAEGPNYVFGELAGALEEVASDLVAVGEGAPLVAILDVRDDSFRERVLGATFRSLGRIWGLTKAGSPEAQAVLSALEDAIDEARAAWNAPEPAPWVGLGRGERLAVASSKWIDSLQLEGFGLAALAVGRFALKIVQDLQEEAYGQSLELDHCRIGLLSQLGTLEMEHGSVEEGHAYLDRALRLADDFLATEPDRPDFAEVEVGLLAALSRMAEIHSAQGREEAARNVTEQAIQLVRDLMAAGHSELGLEVHLCVLLTNLAIYKESDGSTDAARLCCEEAVQLARRSLAGDPDSSDHKHQLCISLLRLSSVAGTEGRSEESEARSSEALRGLRDVVAADPGRQDFQESLARALDWSGQLAASEDRLDEARTLFEEARRMKTRLVEAEPSRSDRISSLALTASNAGVLALRQGRTADARRMFAEQLLTTRGLVVVDPRRVDFKRALMRSLENMATLEETVGQAVEARRLREEARAIEGTLPEESTGKDAP